MTEAVQRQQQLAQQQAAGDNEEEDEPQEAEYVFLGRFRTAIVGIRYYTGRCVSWEVWRVGGKCGSVRVASVVGCRQNSCACNAKHSMLMLS